MGWDIIFLDEFTAANGTAIATHNPLWVVRNGGAEIYTNRVRSTAGGSIITYGVDLDNDQAAACDPWSAYNSLLARFDPSAYSGYMLRPDATLRMYRIDAGGFTQIGSAAVAYAAGKSMRLECVGNLIRGYYDGVLALEVEDSAYSAGRVGLRFEPVGGNGVDNFLIECPAINPLPLALMQSGHYLGA